MTFRIVVELLPPETHVVSLSGELDLYTAPDVEEALLEALSAGSTLVVVDLAAATFVDSVALGVLLRIAEQLRRTGGELAIAGPPDVRRFFAVAGVERVLALFGTRAEALAHLVRRRGDE